MIRIVVTQARIWTWNDLKTWNRKHIYHWNNPEFLAKVLVNIFQQNSDFSTIIVKNLTRYSWVQSGGPVTTESIVRFDT